MNLRKKIVADTNVLVSFFCYPAGTVAEIMNTAIDEKVQMVISEDIIMEFESVINRKFPGLSAQKAEFINFIRGSFELVAPSKKISAVKKDQTDNKIIECANEAEADFIVSGDKHLLEMKRYGKIKIMAPAEFIKLI